MADPPQVGGGGCSFASGLADDDGAGDVAFLVELKQPIDRAPWIACSVKARLIRASWGRWPSGPLNASRTLVHAAFDDRARAERSDWNFGVERRQSSDRLRDHRVHDCIDAVEELLSALAKTSRPVLLAGRTAGPMHTERDICDPLARART